MAGYGSQADYESELLQTYLRRGRVSSISKRDVDLALSIYRMPTKHGKQMTADSARAKAKELGGDDSKIMKFATAAVINKAKADRSKPRIVSGATMAARRAAAGLPPLPGRVVSGATMARRNAGGSLPPPPAPAPTSYYSGPLTPSIAPRPTTTTTTAPRLTTTTRRSRTGYSLR